MDEFIILGYRGLACAIIQRAVRDANGQDVMSRTQAETDAVQTEATNWIEEVHGLFESYCIWLGLEPDEIRKAVG
jgi:hypothetical protein